MNEIITINKLELATELATNATKTEMFSKDLIMDENEMYIGDAGVQYFTDTAQDIFNEYYSYYLTIIEKFAAEWE